MKKIVLALCLVSSLAITLEAQTPNPVRATQAERGNKQQLSPEERAKKDAEQAEKKLALNPDQKAKWELASLERIKEMVPLKEKMQGSTTPQERKTLQSQVQGTKDKFNTTVTALLTPEQLTKYEQLKNEKKSGGHKMREGKARPQINDPK